VCSGKRRFLAILFLVLLICAPLAAHVGSPDVFFQGKAGPYPLLVTIRPPEVIPGVASIEVRALAPGVREVQLTPTPMTGAGSQHPPVADIAQRLAADPNQFIGSLWLMSFGSWEVHVHATGDQGSGEITVPVAAIATKIKAIQPGVEYFLIGMMAFLTIGMVAIVGASVREAQLPAGAPAKPWGAKSVTGMLMAAALLGAALWYGGKWWGDDAALYRQKLYKPLAMAATLNPPDRLELHIEDPGWLALRRLDDLAPDHGHLMHLFLVRWPAMDRVFHLHPDETAPGYFAMLLPSLSAGHYRLFGDIVHETGLAETATGEMDLPEIADGKPLAADDAGGEMPGISKNGDSFELADGYRMVWLRQPGPVVAKRAYSFAFEIVGPDGQPMNDLEPYMGMGGHAEVLKTDGSVFAHIHPTGTVSMGSMAIASPSAMLAMHESNPGPVVSFPYGMPSPGNYRIFVQMKRNGHVETGSFDVAVK
jgi:hypothetical protein